MKKRYLLFPLVVIVLGCTSQLCEPPGDMSCCDPVKVMPLGDSITIGASQNLDPSRYIGYRRDLYCALVSTGRSVDFVGSLQHGQGFDADHEGHSGRTASWLNQRMESLLQASNPDIVLYHIGTNDLWKEDFGTYAGDVNETLEIIYTFDPNITIILAKIVLTLQDPERNVRTHSYNLLLEGIADYWSDAGRSIMVVDMENTLSQTWFDMEDNLHPNANGYAKMADVWYEALAGIVPVCSCTV